MSAAASGASAIADVATHAGAERGSGPTPLPVPDSLVQLMEREEAEPGRLYGDAPSSWSEPEDLSAYLEGDLEPTVPTILRRSDGGHLFYDKAINLLFGPPGSGKTWVALQACNEVLAAGVPVIWVDLEDHPRTMVERLIALGVSREKINLRFEYYRPDGPPTPEESARIVGFSRHGRKRYIPGLIVIDSVGEAIGTTGENENDDAAITAWRDAWAKPFEREGWGVIAIDHTTKADQIELAPSGSKRKMAMVSGAAWRIDVGEPFNREKAGFLVMKCAKDRQGNFDKGARGAVVSVDPTGERMTIYPGAPEDRSPIASSDVLAAVQPMVDLIRYKKPESESALRAIAKAGGHKFTRDVLSNAVALACHVGAVKETRGPRNAKQYEYVRDVTKAELEELAR